MRKSSDRSCCGSACSLAHLMYTESLVKMQTYELTVDITADSDGASDRLDVGFLHEHLASLVESAWFLNGAI